jgi:hypothetical protein
MDKIFKTIAFLFACSLTLNVFLGIKLSEPKQPDPPSLGANQESICPPETFCITKKATIGNNSMTKEEFDEYSKNKQKIKEYLKNNK